jgi:hypothetical protein
MTWNSVATGDSVTMLPTMLYPVALSLLKWPSNLAFNMSSKSSRFVKIYIKKRREAGRRITKQNNTATDLFPTIPTSPS